MLSRRMLRNLKIKRSDDDREADTRTYWSTDLRTPVMDRSFFSSTVTVWSVRVLNNEKISCKMYLSSLRMANAILFSPFRQSSFRVVVGRDFRGRLSGLFQDALCRHLPSDALDVLFNFAHRLRCLTRRCPRSSTTSTASLTQLSRSNRLHSKLFRLLMDRSSTRSCPRTSATWHATSTRLSSACSPWYLRRQHIHGWTKTTRRAQ